MKDYRGVKLEQGQRVKYCGPDFGFWTGTVQELHPLFVFVLRDGDSYPRMVRPLHIVVMDDEETQHDI